ncbi:MAG: glycosyltransferase family 2 protein [Ignavibacteriales bacterium]|nr:glycosyltransferase family 2 protein [Ignavibacteriales bacterium]
MISVAIITRNDESTVARCIKSVLWADEIVVVDAQSTDKTREIAAQAGARVIEKEWEGIFIQQEFALLQTLCEWVLVLEPNEEVSKELKSEILHATQSRTGANGYMIARKSFFLGQWIRYGGWQPEHQLRLFRKSKVRMNYLPGHSGFETEGVPGVIHSLLINHVCTSTHQFIEHLNDYTSLRLLEDDGREKKINFLTLFFSPISVFFRRYVVQLGFMDRLHGFLSAYYASLSTLVTNAKYWEKQKKVNRQ